MSDVARTKYLVRSQVGGVWSMNEDRPIAETLCRKRAIAGGPLGGGEGDVLADVYKVHRFTKYEGFGEFEWTSGEEPEKVDEILLYTVKQARNLQPGDVIFDGLTFQQVADKTFMAGVLEVTHESGDSMLPKPSERLCVVPHDEEEGD